MQAQQLAGMYQARMGGEGGPMGGDAGGGPGGAGAGGPGTGGLPSTTAALGAFKLNMVGGGKGGQAAGQGQCMGMRQNSQGGAAASMQIGWEGVGRGGPASMWTGMWHAFVQALLCEDY